MRLIDADKLKEDFADMRDGYPIFSDTEMLSTKGIAKVIDNAPTISDRPQGEWIEHNSYYALFSRRTFVSCECSACHMYEDFPQDDETGNVITSHYCKWCGSNMWKEEHI